jgi:hypothetical protein
VRLLTKRGWFNLGSTVNDDGSLVVHPFRSAIFKTEVHMESRNKWARLFSE